MVRAVRTEDFDLAVFKDSLLMGVRVLKTYGYEKTCDKKMNNANLYICADIITGDTIYMFDPCGKVPSFIEINPDEGFAILTENIKTEIPDFVNILVPYAFKLPPHAKVVFSEITRLED